MKKYITATMLILCAMGCFYVSFAYADANTISGVATNLKNSFGALAKLVTAGAFLAGLGFAVAAILKFKAHKDNPTQIPVGTPIALLFVAVALLWLPHLFLGLGQSMFGSGAQSGGISGTESLK